jgi:hypothetical protein
LSSKPKQIKSLDDIRGRKKNPNQGTERGRDLTKTSLQMFGAGRSVVVDKDGELIGGHTTTDAFRQIANPDDIIVVPSDGKKLVVVQRIDIDKNDRKAQMLAAVDNITSHVGYNPNNEVLAEIGDDLLTAGFVDESEYDELYASANDDDLVNGANVAESSTTVAPPPASDTAPDTSSQLGALTYRIIIDCKDEAHQGQLLQVFEAEGLPCRPLIS